MYNRYIKGILNTQWSNLKENNILGKIFETSKTNKKLMTRRGTVYLQNQVKFLKIKFKGRQTYKEMFKFVQSNADEDKDKDRSI